MEKIFTNKVAIITGDSFGIGRATLVAFAKPGAKVLIADWIREEEILQQIEEDGGTASLVKCDVSNGNDVRKLIAHTIKSDGRLDYAVNNAGESANCRWRMAR